MNNTIFNNMDGSRHYQTKWSRSDRERKTSYDVIYVKTKKEIQMNLFTKKTRLTNLKNKHAYQREWQGDRLIGGLGLEYVQYCIWNGWPTGTSCIAQGTLRDILWWPLWEKINLKKNGCVYMYNWITLLHSRNYWNIASHLHFNKTLKNEKSKRNSSIVWII